jgi:hypothetical protein
MSVTKMASDNLNSGHFGYTQKKLLKYRPRSEAWK